jgi:hypothetical protein
MGDYTLCGWRVRSALPLPELLPWTGDGRTPDITIRIGEAPALVDPVLSGPFLSIGRCGAGRFEVADVAAFIVRDGAEVTVEPQVPLDAPDIALFLFGSVFGLLCHQRGELPLHGSCVHIKGQAVVFAGPSGAGKSTLAAALLAEGHTLLADDVTVIRPAADGWGIGKVFAIPAFPRQKLWRNSLDALQLAAGRRLRTNGDFEKFEYAVPRAFHAEPVPLAMVCHLLEARLPNLPSLEKLSGFDAMAHVRSVVYRLRAGQQLDGGARIFANCAALAAAVPQYRLHRPAHFDELRAFAKALPNLLGL